MRYLHSWLKSTKPSKPPFSHKCDEMYVFMFRRLSRSFTNPLKAAMSNTRKLLEFFKIKAYFKRHQSTP